MANEVFANGREIACKSGSARVIASFPDVCFTPPQTAATPPGLPIPYPITSMSSDTTKGSRTVKINRKEVMLRNKSFYKKCTGDEAGNAPKKGLITSSHKCKTYFRAWSMNVKIENENAVRHFDITTSNHRSEGPNAAIPNVNTEGQAPPTTSDKCRLRTYDEGCEGENETPHHIIADSQFRAPGPRGSNYYQGIQGMTEGNGLCICLEGQDKAATKTDAQLEEMGIDPNDIPAGRDGVRRLNKTFLRQTRQAPTGRVGRMFPDWAGTSPFSMTRAEHGRFHEQYDNIVESIGADKTGDYKNTATFGECRDVAADLCHRMYGCDREDIKSQVDNHYSQFNVNENTVLRSSGKSTMQPPNPAVLGTR